MRFWHRERERLFEERQRLEVFTLDREREQQQLDSGYAARTAGSRVGQQMLAA